MPPADRKRPVRFVAITASHELLPSAEAALDEAVRLRLERRLELRRQADENPTWSPYAVENTRLVRSIEGGVDDLKFLYPVLDNLPLLVFPLLHYAAAGAAVGARGQGHEDGVRLCFYGPPEACRVVEVVRDYLLEIGWLREAEQLLTIEEDRDRISFSHSFLRSSEPFDAGADDAIVWTAADLVLAYNVWPWFLDRAIEEDHLLINMIARDRIFPEGEPEFLRLNYFDRLRPEGCAEALAVKQPDVIVFTGEGRRGLERLNRIRGQSEGALLGIFLRATWRGLFSPNALSVLKAMRYGIHRKRYTLKPGEGLSERDGSRFASVFFGVPTKVQAKIADPFILKDGDGFEDVFGYYRALLQRVVDSAPSREEGYAKLARVHPYAEQLWQLSERLRPLWDELPLWRRWPEFINDKIATYNRRLQREFAAAGVDDGTLPLPTYFDADGRFLPQPSLPHADIDGSLDYLRRVYRPGFEQARRQYLGQSAPTGANGAS